MLSKMIGACGVAAMAGVAWGQVSATAVVLEGDMIAGRVIDLVSAPKVNGNGEVGYIAEFDDNVRGIVIGGAVVFLSSDAVGGTLSGNNEDVFGIGNNGEFIYSQAFNGADAVYGQGGLIAVENVQAPDYPAGIESTFHSSPRMVDDGTAFWLAGVNDGSGTATASRAIFRRDAGTGAITTFVRTGDVIDGREVGTVIDFDFAFSSDGSNAIFAFDDADRLSSSNGTVAANGVVVAQEGSSTGDGDNWDNFGDFSINNAGNFLFSGDTDGATSNDSFIAYNGVIAVREGDIVDGLAVAGLVQNLQINDLDEAVFTWDGNDGSGNLETLFYAADAADLGGAVALLRERDIVDLGVDGLWTVIDFDAEDTGALGFRENGLVTVEVDLRSLDGATDIEALITLVVPAPGAGAMLAAGLLAAGRRRR